MTTVIVFVIVAVAFYVVTDLIVNKGKLSLFKRYSDWLKK